MSLETSPESTAFKDWFNEPRYRQLAHELGLLSPSFSRRRFLRLTLEGLEERELMERLRQTARAFEAAQPGTYPEKLDILQRLAPRLQPGFVTIWLCEFVALFGLGDPARSLAALRVFTRFGSAEFAVRPFLQQDLAGTLAVMRRWARDPDEHVRRLASEGSRPRLPWGARLGELVRDPAPNAPLLEALKADDSPYVRRSVANHLNDITKDHPEWVLDRLEQWDLTDERPRWIVRHGLRTLIKRGHPRALQLVGADPAAAALVTVESFLVRPRRHRLGEPLELRAALRSSAAAPARLVVDYVIHYVKASGRTSPKVFKWTVVPLDAGATVTLSKRQLIRDFSTRRHHAGRHRVELQVNGQRLAEDSFQLLR